MNPPYRTHPLNPPLNIQRQPGTNTVEVVGRVKDLMPTFRNLIPPSVTLNLLMDRSESVRASVDDVQFEMVLTVGLVVMVIFLFLRTLTESPSVNCTSWTDSRIDIDLSMRISISTDAGSCWRRVGSRARIRLATSIVFEPG